jgi:hypothetical protein
MLTDASISALTGAVVWQIAQEEVQVLQEQAMASCGRNPLPGKPSSRTRLTTIWTEAWPGRPRLTEHWRAPGPATARPARPAAADDAAMPLQDGAGSDDEPRRGEALDRQRPSRQCWPRTV